MSEAESAKPIVLTIAGSDPSGGAGIQADLKTIDRFGGYGMSAITAVTSQNTEGVQDILSIPTEHVRSQLASLEQDDLPIRGIKTGMLPSVECIEIIASFIIRSGVKNVVIDPVLQATSGVQLADDRVEAYKELLFPLASCVTPNLPELSQFIGSNPTTLSELTSLTEKISLLASSVLVTGGHMPHSEIADVLFDDNEPLILRHPKVITSNLHGTGCVLSSAIVVNLAFGYSVRKSVQEANAFLQSTIEESRENRFGKGNGPVLQ